MKKREKLVFSTHFFQSSPYSDDRVIKTSVSMRFHQIAWLFASVSDWSDSSPWFFDTQTPLYFVKFICWFPEEIFKDFNLK